MKTKILHWTSLAFVFGFFAMVGCNNTELLSLEGKVVVQGDPSFSFAGDTVVLRSQSDQSQQVFGEIKPDGSFRIETLNNGLVAQGAKPGPYDAKIVFSDDDFEHKKLASKSINKKFLSFETSGLKVSVPSSGVTLSISK